MDLGQTELKPDQVEELRCLFGMFDENNDGVLSKDELEDVLQIMGHRLSEVQLQRTMKAVDTDKSGSIEFPEFMVMLKEMLFTNNSDAEIRACFDEFDCDKDGFLSAEDLRQALSCMGEKITELEAKFMVEEADCNNDGLINYREFYNMMTKH